MLDNKCEYQSLESRESAVRQRPTTRVVWCFLILVQLTMLGLWAFALVDKSRNEGDVVDFTEEIGGYVEDPVFAGEDTFGRREGEVPVWRDKDRCAFSGDAEKFDCHPELGANRETCGKRGCCWEPAVGAIRLGVPSCYYPRNYGGYRLVNASRSESGARAFFARTFPSPYPNDILLVRMDVEYQSRSRLRVKISDAESDRYEPPLPHIPVSLGRDPRKPEYRVALDSRGFKVLRNEKDIVFDAQGVGAFIFADQFLQISARFSGKIYGLGEHRTSLQLSPNWTQFTLFNRDGVPKLNTNLYGSHPFYLVLEPSGKSHGVFFHNSNAMDVVLQPLPAVTFRSIGGVFDFYFFFGPTPAEVIKQYTEVVGRTFFPPYWSLGFHLSRLGYKNTSDIRAVWKRTILAEIPFDVQWHDIDYMDKRKDFTFDRKNYAGLPKFVDEVHETGMRYIPILDPGISGCEPEGTYPPYDEGLEGDVFVKNEDGSVFVGKVWNVKCTVFPDFTAASTVPYWSKQIRKWHDSVRFDGLWIDMNEPTNFLDGSFDGCPSNKWENPVFAPNVSGGALRSWTICMSARQSAGRHYDVHNLYGISEAAATHGALRDLGKRPFVISRSTYPGIGKYAGHWSGDIESTWSAMKQTIPEMLSFSLFGVAMMGADICGFNGNATVSLCRRWSQLGAFYPFSRNHNSDDCIDQDPVAMGDDVVKSVRKALRVRYALLPHLYTLFYIAHTKGETVVRPVFFEFWDDPRTHDWDSSFLWGCCILIVPVLENYATTVETYLPAARWYDWYTGEGVQSNGTKTVLRAPSDTIPVFVRGGVILPTQAPNLTTAASRKNDIELIAAFDASLGATGTFYWDDGESLDALEKGDYGEVDFFLTAIDLCGRVKRWATPGAPQLGSVKILGFVTPVRRIYFNKKEIRFRWDPTKLGRDSFQPLDMKSGYVEFSVYLACLSFILNFYASFVAILGISGHLLAFLIVSCALFCVLLRFRIPRPKQTTVKSIFGANWGAYASLGTEEGKTDEGYVMKVIGHRACGLDAPENSISALDKISKEGMTAVEFDVLMTADDVPVVFHDISLSRMTQSNRTVRETTYEDIQKLDISLKHPFGKNFRGEKIPTLYEYVRFCLDSGIRMFIDLKEAKSDIARVINDMFKQNPRMYDAAVVSSFDPILIYKIRARDPNIACSLAWRPYFYSHEEYSQARGPRNPRTENLLNFYLLRALDGFHQWALWKFGYYVLGLSALLLHKDMITLETIRYWHKRGIRVIAWSVNLPTEKQYFEKILEITYLTDTTINS